MEIEETRRSLPIFASKNNILNMVKNNRVIIVTGETGSGKTTQLPQYLFEAGYKKVACTQPRRIAAIGVAERVAVEMNTHCGDVVGYRVRFDDKTSPRTQLLYLTDGMMLREMMADPMLKEYRAVMVDEAHERSVTTDILLGLLKDLSLARQGRLPPHRFFRNS